MDKCITFNMKLNHGSTFALHQKLPMAAKVEYQLKPETVISANLLVGSRFVHEMCQYDINFIG